MSTGRDDARPRTIIFFNNGNTAVCDQYGQQMPKYQKYNCHADTIAALAADGIDWQTLPDRCGNPLP